jgi:hypothetical protein
VADKVAFTYDFYAWAMRNAELLRQGRFSEIDAEHIAEEVEDMGASAKRELLNHLGVLLARLLKWQYQPGWHSKGWKYTIKEQRQRIDRLLQENPSLRHKLSTVFEQAYGDAVLMAVKETTLEEEAFPASCPWSFDQVIVCNLDSPLTWQRNYTSNQRSASG